MASKQLPFHPSNNWAGKSVLITGVCGTIGSSILSELATFKPKEIIGIDNNECTLFHLQNKYIEQDNIRLYLGDVRDLSFLMSLMSDIDVVLHTAALKHVPICERVPGTTVATNIGGVQNIIEAAMAADVERVIFTSSDKAVNPTNVMGTSKLMGERLITAANTNRRGKRTIFASTRFGNVLGSRGSVIPIFHNQIKQGGPVTLTHPRMTRFFMSLRQAVQLVLDSTFFATGGEVLVTKMPVMRIEQLADVMISYLSTQYSLRSEDIEKKIIGTKPGEKLYEELVSEEEIPRSIELERFYVVLPTVEDKQKRRAQSYQEMHSLYPEKRCYNSSMEAPISDAELKKFLITNGLLTGEQYADKNDGYSQEHVQQI